MARPFRKAPSRWERLRIRNARRKIAARKQAAREIHRQLRTKAAMRSPPKRKQRKRRLPRAQAFTPERARSDRAADADGAADGGIGAAAREMLRRMRKHIQRMGITQGIRVRQRMRM